MTTELNNLQWIVKRKISHSVFVGLVLSTFLRKFPEKLGEGINFLWFFSLRSPPSPQYMDCNKIFKAQFRSLSGSYEACSRVCSRKRMKDMPPI